MRRKWWLVALMLALGLALAAPLASSSPDGLERVAEDKGFSHAARLAPFQLIADYLLPGIHNEALATMLAGVIGVLVLFGLVYGLARLAYWTRRQQPNKGGNG